MIAPKQWSQAATVLYISKRVQRNTENATNGLWLWLLLMFVFCGSNEPSFVDMRLSHGCRAMGNRQHQRVVCHRSRLDRTER